MDISAVTGRSQNLVTGAAQTVPIAITGTGPFVRSLTVTPKPTTPGLITIDASGSLVFAASSAPADANTYTIVVYAKVAGSNDCRASAPATYKYRNCETAIITTTAFSNLETSVFV